MVNLKGKDTTRSQEMGHEIHSCFVWRSFFIAIVSIWKNPDKSYNCHFESLDQVVICTVLGIRNGPWMKELQDPVVTEFESNFRAEFN